MAGPARKSERGLTLVETVVALAIVFIVFLGLTDVGLLVLDHNINNVIRDEGVRVAEMQIERLKSTPFDNIASGVGMGPIGLPTETRRIRGLSKDYAATYEVTALNLGNLQVVVNVTWDRGAWTPSGRQQRSYSHQVVSIVSNR